MQDKATRATGMRNRHVPRTCRECHAPMASGSGTCWRCGVRWAAEDAPAPALRLVPGPAPDDHGRSDVERWANEGGSYRADVAMRRRAVMGR
jgi:hypothetical protein